MPPSDDGEALLLTRKQAEAEARRAIAEARKAAHDAAELVDPDLKRRQQEAETRKAVAEADLASANARRAQVSDLLPDLRSVQQPETVLPSDRGLFASVLAHRALVDAANRLVDAVRQHVNRDDGIFVTADFDLATADAPYVEVMSAFDQLISAADEVLEKTAAPVEGQMVEPSAAIGGLAAALPGLLSTFRTRRSVASAAVDVDALAALAAVAGRLARGHRVHLDEFRLVPNGEVAKRQRKLADRRTELLDAHDTSITERGNHEATASEKQRAIYERERDLDAIDLPRDEAIVAERAGRDAALASARAGARRAAAIDALIQAIDSFSVAVHTVPDGGRRRSPFVEACLHEGFRSSGTPRCTRVLCVRSSSGSIDQVFRDRPMNLRDTFEGVASVSLSYWLIEVPSSRLIAAGVINGAARLQGKVGGKITFSVVPET